MAQKKWEAIPSDLEKVKALQQDLKINPIILQLLVQRGIHTYDEAKTFFRPSLAELHDPFLMKDMDKAAARVAEALGKGEKILLYGDYDVDGTTCVATMYSFLRKIAPDTPLDYYIPSRYKEGYGISRYGLEYAQEIGATLMIAMDCGIRAVQQMEWAKEMGLDCIICDHHLPGPRLPDALAVLDPKRSDDHYPYKELSGCGVTFKLVQAIAQLMQKDAESYLDALDLLVLSIGCDIVPITGENRILAYHGLKQINEKKARLGVRALIEKSGREYPASISSLVFGAGPMINAAGRLHHAKAAVELLLSQHEEEAQQMAQGLHEQNVQRRQQDRSITAEASAILDALPGLPDLKSIVLCQPNWHKGVLGIAASKLVERYFRPTIILSEDNGRVVGSARSVPGFDIHEAICECGDLLLSYGGHHHAAGLSMEASKLPTFQARFEEVVAHTIDPEALVPILRYATELDLKDITPSFWRVLQQFAPFGPGNRRPVFLSKQVQDSGYSKVVKEEHLKLHIRQANSPSIGGIGFWMGDKYERVSQGPFDICYVIEPNHWQGRTSLDLQVKDIK